MTGQGALEAWDGWCGQLTADALALAAGCDDATKAARLLAENADRHCVGHHRDRVVVLTALRWRLAGLLDRQPDDLVALSALGIAALAALEPGADLEGRHEITQTAFVGGFGEFVDELGGGGIADPAALFARGGGAAGGRGGPVVSGAVVVVVGGAVVVVVDVVVEVVVVVGRSVVVVRSVVSVGSRMSVSSSSPPTTLPIITGGHLRARPDTRPAHKLGLWMATPIVVCLRGRSTSVSEVGQWAARHEPIRSDEDDCAAPALAGPRSTLTMKGRTA